MTKRIVVSSDHAGLELKRAMKTFLAELGYQVEDVGTHTPEPVDYPEFTRRACERVISGEFTKGIVFCGTGQGDVMVANKIPGIRAALCGDPFSAELSRSHIDSNVLVLGGWMVGEWLAKEIVRAWLTTPFEGGRHERRLQQISAIEQQTRLSRRKVYDVSLPIYAGMPVWPGHPEVGVDVVKAIDRGETSNVSLIHIGTHTATHVDAPRHFYSESPGVDTLPGDVLTGPCRLFQMPSAHHIDSQLLTGLDLRGVSRLLLATRNSALLKRAQISQEYAYITEDAARYLVDKGVKLVGLDYISIEQYQKEGRPAHHILLGAGVAVLEGVYLEGVPAGDYELLCLPLKLTDGDGAPARVLLRQL